LNFELRTENGELKKRQRQQQWQSAKTLNSEQRTENGELKKRQGQSAKNFEF
jgi:hypothetical protein